ncbi:hypothetical protein OWR29_22265 [Actinoplanes sp. Pm04-4]|uniref:Uncharacterized protein n=1 Tax=Paractinoplanes pyxinae TaxID=2997416 RepID=A0ABT4B2K7_9ACTN|nr:DUF6886 family protein [Actinoplanes pyxinae]MCY1140732.1 hypothetical protein [Actinoplanes pyxinae]
MRPRPGEVLHFSEDPTIARFVPHVAPTSREAEAYVWAVDGDRAPDYWFPRQCPRAMAWVTGRTSDVDRDRIVGAGSGVRVHAIEYGWLEALRTARLYAYRLPAAPFRPIASPDSQPHAMVATEPVEPLGPAEEVGDLLACHEAAGIQLRVLDNLWPFWDQVVESTLGFSGIRLRNAKPRPAAR